MQSNTFNKNAPLGFKIIYIALLYIHSLYEKMDENKACNYVQAKQ